MIEILLLIISLFLVYYFLNYTKKLQRKTKCPVCDGTGKIWGEVHDSADLQVINCSRCEGKGKIPKKPKRKEGTKMPILLTENALKKIKELMETNNPKFEATTTFLRMGVKGGGCSGFSYLLEFDGEITANDKVFEFSLPETADTEPKLKVVVDKKSYLYLNGTTLDYTTVGLESGFKFDNPKVKSSCGCGTSFSA